MDTIFARNNNETTPHWLERLISLSAPAHIISAVQTLLQIEAQSVGGGPLPGKENYCPNSIIPFCLPS